MQEDYKENFIIIKKITNDSDRGYCCLYKGTIECVCKVMVFKVRPYAYQWLRALQPFFEIIVFSEMYYKILEYIIDYIEGVLNKPIQERIQQFELKMEQGI